MALSAYKNVGTIRADPKEKARHPKQSAGHGTLAYLALRLKRVELELPVALLGEGHLHKVALVPIGVDAPERHLAANVGARILAHPERKDLRKAVEGEIVRGGRSTKEKRGGGKNKKPLVESMLVGFVKPPQLSQNVGVSSTAMG